MAWFPGADRSVVGSSPGSYVSSPWKLIIHTTEGGSAEGAFSAYRANNTWPHATIDGTTIYQHLSTDTSGSALRNLSGGVETNRARAIQIEMVAYAGSPKSHAMLENVAAFCAWVEETHGVAHTWPAGRPKGSGGPHNRSTTLWTTESGYYGHSQAPESDHWDPGYLSDEELDILMGGVVTPIYTRINGADQTATVKGWLHDGNSVMDVSDWCSFSRTPVPVFDNSTKNDTYAGTLDFWTYKTACQVLTPEGSCGKPSVGLVAIPLPSLLGCTVTQSLCADHAAALTAPPAAPTPEPPATSMQAGAATSAGAVVGGACPVDP